MRNTRKFGQILKSKERLRPTLRTGRGSRINCNTSHQIPARVIEAETPRAVSMSTPRKEPFEPLKGIAEQITGTNSGGEENYVSWVQQTMSASPWGSTDLNKKLLSYATENVSAVFGFVQKLSQAKNLEDVVKIQTEFMSAQLSSFNE